MPTIANKRYFKPLQPIFKRKFKAKYQNKYFVSCKAKGHTLKWKAGKIPDLPTSFLGMGTRNANGFIPGMPADFKTWWKQVYVEGAISPLPHPLKG